MTCRRGDGVEGTPSTRRYRQRRVDGARTPLQDLLRLGLGELGRALHRVPFLRLRVDGLPEAVELLLQRRDLLLRQEERRLRLR